MREQREEQRRVTMRYRHDPATGRTTLVIDVEVPEDEMPHEHRQELREMAEEVLGVPLSSLPEDVTVNLRRPSARATHDHAHDHDHSNDDAHGAAVAGAVRDAERAGR